MAIRNKGIEKRKENLILYEKGQSGNPRGMIPGVTNYRYQFNRFMLDASLAIGKHKKPKAHDILNNIVDAAVQGKQTALKIWMEQAYQGDWISEIEEYETRGEKRELAFLHYQLHKGATDIQRQILFSRAKYLALMAGRRGGKSEGLVRWFADEFIDNSAARCLYIGLTVTTAMALLWQPMLDHFAMLGIKVEAHSRTEGTITVAGGGILKFGGNTTVDEREKNRGPRWDRIAIDECQSQKELNYLVESILTPTLIDTNGQLALCGTGPRSRGSYWEAFFLGAKADGTPMYPDALRLNWNLSKNPFIPDYDKQLEMIRKEKNLKETDSLYIREYLGQIAYDDDALAFRMTDKNAFTDEELAAWIKDQPITDIRFTGGLDFGFEDADALAIVCYSISKPERFLVYEWKENRIGTAQIAEEVNKGIEYVKTSPLFAKVVSKDFYIHSDTGGNKLTPFDLATQYNLPIQAAYKADKDMAIELAQDDMRRGILKVRRHGVFWEETLMTLYKRDEQDKLTRIIDDELFHPDMIDAFLYAIRPIQLFETKVY
jgi:hypothetical protein